MFSAVAAVTVVMMVIMYVSLAENEVDTSEDLQDRRLHDDHFLEEMHRFRMQAGVGLREDHMLPERKHREEPVEVNNFVIVDRNVPPKDLNFPPKEPNVPPNELNVPPKDLNFPPKDLNVLPKDPVGDQAGKFEPRAVENLKRDKDEKTFTVTITAPRSHMNVSSEHHHEDAPHFHHWHVERPLAAVENERSVAIGLGLTTRGQPGLTADRAPSELPFFRRLLLSFCHTSTYGYEYHFYIAHDHNDPYFQYRRAHTMFEVYFSEFVARNCPSNVNVTLHLVECSHSGHPAWAQNDAMMDAYLDNIAYFYRVNDDSVMETTGWTERLIEQLLRMNPRNVGVAGPWFRDGNTAILTHDFVHRTHIDIFGFYYPRVFPDWFADDWITGVYYPERSHKVHGVRITHTMELGSRYVVHFEKALQVAREVEIGRRVIKRWLMGREGGAVANPNSTFVVALALHGGSHDATFGALRYAQLVPVYLKDWRVRVYLEDPATDTIYLPVPNYMMRKMEMMGIEAVFVNKSISDHMPPDMWPFLIADDSGVVRFMVRDARMRPSEREFSALRQWLASNRPFHCIRDHPRHSTLPITPTLTAGHSKQLRAILQRPWIEMMSKFKSDIHFTNKGLWPLLKQHTLCHDSVSCHNWTSSEAFPELRNENEFVGRMYDENDQPEKCDSRSWSPSYSSPDCVKLKETGFQEAAVRRVVRMRPVIWSQDYHITPIMDIKSLLAPIGVKIIDKSLSYHCGKMGTCAAGLRVITQENGMRLSPMLIEKFYRSYIDDLEMKEVTAYVCALPVAMCEAFLHFNRSIIVWATTRYEQGRPEPDKWEQLNENLLSIANHPTSVLAANNLYDLKYMEYFLGVTPKLLPNYCAYLRDSYKPSQKQFLVSPIHSTELSELFYKQLDEALMAKLSNLVLLPLRQMYPQYLFSDLASHPGIVYIPYQVSMVSLTEHYRMNIPLFFPTVDLLALWQLEYQVVRQRTWAGYMMKRPHRSGIPGKARDVPDPNDDTDEGAIKYWLKFADFYQWPHIIYYSSIPDLVDKLITTNLTDVSLKMQSHNIKASLQIKDAWSEVLLKVTGGA